MSIFDSLKNQTYAYWRSTEVTVAVAGLSRSGKTAFITSLIANLEAASRNSNARKWLNGLDVVDTARLRSAERPSAFKPSHGRLFPYSDMVASISADSPKWPVRTANIYETAIDLNFWPIRRPEQQDVPTAWLRLKFIDYPGEWLVDVPLSNQTYLEWSKAALNRLASSPWSEVSSEFLAFLDCVKWSESYSNETARRAALQWQGVLISARDKGLKWLQPGQFVRRRDHSEEERAPTLDEDKLWFCPLPEKAINMAPRGSLASEMSRKYETYRRETQEFFSHTLKEASRHLLLVDVLDALAEGEHGFHETAEVLGEVYRVFSESNSGIFPRLFSRASFEKVSLLATKADTVPPNQRAALSSLLGDMCSGRVSGAAKIAPPNVAYAAAIRATQDVELDLNTGEAVRVVQGLCSELGKVCRVTSADIPESIPNGAYFARRAGMRFPQFVPCKIGAGGRYGVPNLRMGKVLDDLLGDLLQ